MTNENEGQKINSKLDLIRFIISSQSKNKTDLCKKLGASRPTIYRMLDKYDLGDDHLTALFAKSKQLDEDVFDVSKAVFNIHGECQHEEKEYKDQKMVIVDDEIIYRIHRGKLKSLPEVKRGNHIYFSWNYNKKHYMIKKACLIYCLAYGFGDIKGSFKVVFRDRNDENFKAKNLRLVPTSKYTNKARLEFLDMIEIKIGLVPDEKIIKILKAYFGK